MIYRENRLLKEIFIVKAMVLILLFLISSFSFAGAVDDIPNGYFASHADMCDSCTNSNTSVGYLQRVLNADDNLSINISEDGFWGGNTKNAVKSFQSYYSLGSDGWVGSGTKVKLDVVLQRLKTPQTVIDVYNKLTFRDVKVGTCKQMPPANLIRHESGGSATLSLSTSPPFQLISSSQVTVSSANRKAKVIVKFCPTQEKTYSGQLNVTSLTSGVSLTRDNVSLVGIAIGNTYPKPQLLAPGTASSPGSEIKLIDNERFGFSWNSSASGIKRAIYLKDITASTVQTFWTSNISKKTITGLVPDHHYYWKMKVCDGSKNNCSDYSSRLYFQTKALPPKPAIISITPSNLQASFYKQNLVINGSNFEQNAELWMSIDGVQYSKVTENLNVTSTKISLKMVFLSLQASQSYHFKVRNGNLSDYSNTRQLSVQFSPPYNPRLWVADTETGKNIKSGESISITLSSFDLDNLGDKYALHINWGDKQVTNRSSLTQGATIPMTHRYTSTKSKSHTVNVYVQDKDGHKSTPVSFRVSVKGSGQNARQVSQVSNKAKKYGRVQTGRCRSVQNSVDTAVGAENFTIDLLKTTGLSVVPFSLSYNSALLSSGNMSNGWSHNYKFTSYLEIQQNEDVRIYWDDSVKKYNDFSEEIFESKIYKSVDKDVADDILLRNADDSFTLTRKNRVVYEYNRDGRLTSISNYKNNKLDLTFADGKIFKVTEPVSGVHLIYRYTYNPTDKTNKLSQVEDNSGRTVSLEYDTEGNLNQINATEGATYTFVYNELGQVEEYKINGVEHFTLIYDDKGRVKNEDDGRGNATAVVDYSFDEITIPGRILSQYKNKSGKITTYNYDADNYNLYSATDPRGFTIDNEYYTSGNNKGKIKKRTDKRGNSSQYEYDNKGNLIKITYDDGSKIQYQYDSRRNKTNIKTISKTGEVYEVKNTFDSNNNLKTSTNANQKTTTFTYNANNQLLTKTTPEGITTRNEYTSGRLTKTTYAYGTADQNSIQFGYDAVGRLTTETDPFGKVTHFTYDSADRLKKVEDPLGNTITHKYDYQSNRTETKDKNGNITTFEYDNNNNLIRKTAPLGAVYQYEYDSSDRLSKEIDPLGHETTFEYDEVGNLVKQTDAYNNAVRFVYDGEGNLFKQYDAYNQRITINDYDIHGNLIETKDALNRLVKKEYDVLGNATKITDPLNRVTQLAYDNLGQLKTVTNHQNKTVTQSYDNDGRLKFFTDTNGNKTTFTYDNISNIATTTTASGSVSSNSYISNRLSKTKNGRNDERNYSYDDLSRVTSISDPEGTIEYSYDNNGNVLTVKENGKTITRTYDALNRVKTYSSNASGTTIGLAYDYDEASNLTQLTYSDNKKVNYSYDNNNRLASVTDWNNKTTSYEYDKNGRLNKMTRPNGTVLTRIYNNAGQLTQQKDVTASGTVIAQYDYEYDTAGNISTEDTFPPVEPKSSIDLTMTYKSGNQLNTVNTKSPVFDADENMTSLPLANSIMTLAYDSRNRLVSGAGVTSAYDAENHRISSTNAQGKTDYVINPESPLSQVLTMNQPNAGKTRYLYGNGLLAQEKDGQTLYYHYDLRGSTVALTNQNGDIVDRFSYLPFGGVIEHTLGNTETPYLYNGRDGVMNDNNGLYYMRARFYSPEIRRFVNRDLLLGDVMTTNALNRFAYVNGNPVSLVDPLGLLSWDDFTWQNISEKGANLYVDATDLAGRVGKDLRRGKEGVFKKIRNARVKLERKYTGFKTQGRNTLSKISFGIQNHSNKILGKVLKAVAKKAYVIPEFSVTQDHIINNYDRETVGERATLSFAGAGDIFALGFIRNQLRTPVDACDIASDIGALFTGVDYFPDKNYQSIQTNINSLSLPYLLGGR